ncbi:MAG: DUF1573 domain-containing protein [Alistipes sp.]|nr:DUF1573 domain-containing protein [Alistipes sp.]
MRVSLTMVVLLLFVACGSRPQPKETTPYGQKLLLSDSIARFGGADTIRFGQMHEGEIAEKPLQLVNEGKTPLVIRTVERTCGCTTLEYENQPLMPGERRQITLRFDARGEWGWQLKLLRLYLNDGQEPLRLYVEADIE